MVAVVVQKVEVVVQRYPWPPPLFLCLLPLRKGVLGVEGGLGRGLGVVAPPPKYRHSCLHSLLPFMRMSSTVRRRGRRMGRGRGRGRGGKRRSDLGWKCTRFYYFYMYWKGRVPMKCIFYVEEVVVVVVVVEGE